ncbi:cupredoxin domain-containing protein [Alkalihalobacillus macyae]|uniref:cupredoxin domain-containing protein n=1 Tax=Guptibacillus hwajinpoensis TaxID=208199 RepID=UPI00273A8300|nr:cupredoxin domain-containing protein [Alkalihalobacillus macyae]MDP4549616.1 cupredoxin domain-containing protein [Alkalihalobacillus macyae]
MGIGTITFLEISFAAIIILWIIKTVFTNRGKLTTGAGMMTAMSFGMMIGLVGGVIIGVSNPQGILYSTIIGVTIGLVGGFITGLPFTIMAVLDGSLSGMMGGMMGAMLGEMILSKHAPILINYMFWMFICFSLILIYFLYDVLTIKLPLIIRNPLLLVTVFALFFYTFEQLNIGSEEIKNNKGVASPHSAHELGTGSLSPQLDSSKLDMPTVVIATDFSYSPATIRVDEGIPFLLVLKNNGGIEHDLEITNSQGVLVHLHVQPGEETKENISLPRGTYQYVCTVPGHKESGMVGSMIVS